MENDIRHIEPELAVQLLQAQYRREIEKAIDQAKRTSWDKWFRKQFYRAAAQRERRYRRQRSPWHRQIESGACGHGGNKNGTSANN